jgi:putative endonuclease
MDCEPWYLYMVRCQDASIYVGVTQDVPRRFAEHCAQGARCAKYLRGRAPLQLISTFELANKREALQLEYRLKRKSRQQKEALASGKVALQELILL